MKMNRLFIAATLLAATCFALPSFAQKAKLTDPEIAHIAVTANQIDINAAQQAQSKSKDGQITQFAQTMINDHKAVIDQAVALAKKLNVTPADNATSKKLNADAEKTKKRLDAMSGKDFEKAYVDNEVAYHKAVISTVEHTLIPEAQNKELKELLTKVLPTLKAHLGHAEMLQKMYHKK